MSTIYFTQHTVEHDLLRLVIKTKKLVFDGLYIYDILYKGIKVCVFAVENRTRVYEQRRENNPNDSFV